MNQGKTIETIVGLFILAGILALLFLAFRVSGLSANSWNQTYNVKANFDNIGNLRIRSPVKIAGVRVGEVSQIKLDSQTFQATVMMSIDRKDDNIPLDTQASILTEGLLGSNYIGLTPGFDTAALKNGSTIETTHPALILENLIGQFLFKIQGGSGSSSNTNANSSS